MPSTSCPNVIFHSKRLFLMEYGNRDHVDKQSWRDVSIYNFRLLIFP